MSKIPKGQTIPGDEPAYCLILTERQLAMLYARSYNGGGYNKTAKGKYKGGEIDEFNNLLAKALLPGSSNYDAGLRLEARDLVDRKFGFPMRFDDT